MDLEKYFSSYYYYDWEYSLDISEYQYNGYRFKVTLISYSAGLSTYRAGNSFDFVYNFVSEKGTVTITTSNSNYSYSFYLNIS